MSPPRVTPAALVARLAAAAEGHDSVGLAFDGDGTLWSGDVGDDLFFHALEHGLLRPAADAPLRELATQHGLDAEGSREQVARTIYAAHHTGAVPQTTTYAMMAWCFAGYSPPELATLTHEVLAATRLTERHHEELRAPLEWARARGARTIVVSASPRVVVEVAAHTWGFDPDTIVAATPELDEQGLFAPRLAAPVPYGPEKTAQGRPALNGAFWLAAFGDNSFDAEMLDTAAIGVAVRPKPALLARLDELPRALVLEG